MPLTAKLDGVPDAHDGKRTFTFGLTFSEEPEVGFRTLRDEAFDVDGGVVRKARRRQSGSDLSWEITVEPDSHRKVSIRLLETTSCSASRAICTSDGRPLSHFAVGERAGAGGGCRCRTRGSRRRPVLVDDGVRRYLLSDLRGGRYEGSVKRPVSMTIVAQVRDDDHTFQTVVSARVALRSRDCDMHELHKLSAFVIRDAAITPEEVA